MAYPSTDSTRLRSGNPALSEKFVETNLSAPATRSMTVAGVSMKTLVLLIVLVAGGAWGWASATEPVGVDLGGGYANTTVTIPGGFWLASFGAFFLGIFIAVQPRRAALLGVALRAVRRVLPRSDLGDVRRPDRGHRRRRDPVDGVRVRRVACSCTSPGSSSPPRSWPSRSSPGWAGSLLLYFFVFILSIFNWGWLYSDSFRTVGVVVTLIAIVLAALSLVLDFATIEAGSRRARRRSWSGTWRSG